MTVYKLSSEGKEQILHILKEGDTFGAVPVFYGRTFPANARVLTKCYLLFFDSTDFTRFITDKPNIIVMNLLALLAARLREFTVLVENLALKEISGRIASYLLYLSQEQNSTHLVRLNISKNQLANLLGTGPESLSRALRDLKTQKFISEKEDTIELLDIAKPGRQGKDCAVRNSSLPLCVMQYHFPEQNFWQF